MEIKRDVYPDKLIGRTSSAMGFGFGDFMPTMEKVNQEQRSPSSPSSPIRLEVLLFLGRGTVEGW